MFGVEHRLHFPVARSHRRERLREGVLVRVDLGDISREEVVHFPCGDPGVFWVELLRVHFFVVVSAFSEEQEASADWTTCRSREFHAEYDGVLCRWWRACALISSGGRKCQT